MSIIDYGKDFLAGADPTGLASLKRAQNVKENHGRHRFMNDMGGFALGAGISTALSGGALLAGSLLAKGSTKKVLRQAAKDTMLVFKPKQALKSLKGLNESYPILQKQERISKELLGNPNLKSLLKTNTNNVDDVINMGQQYMGKSQAEITKMKQEAQTYKDALNDLETTTKNFKEKYNEDPLSISRKGAAVAGTIATGLLGGGLNAMTSDIQYQSGRKFKEYDDKLSKYEKLEKENKLTKTGEYQVNSILSHYFEKQAMYDDPAQEMAEAIYEDIALKDGAVAFPDHDKIKHTYSKPVISRAGQTALSTGVGTVLSGLTIGPLAALAASLITKNKQNRLNAYLAGTLIPGAAAGLKSYVDYPKLKTNYENLQKYVQDEANYQKALEAAKTEWKYTDPSLQHAFLRMNAPRGRYDY